ncbi:hypothetical protein [Nocardia acidivorans]|uniref:hypothetical protein n=1 Tax=Nocardia acidivorans TaxID=404580 RepID=UPI00082D08C6|nr:hypothetical protein [Nocardia acidivorans]
MIVIDRTHNTIARSICVDCDSPTNYVPLDWASGQAFLRGDYRMSKTNIRCDDCIDRLYEPRR